MTPRIAIGWLLLLGLVGCAAPRPVAAPRPLAVAPTLHDSFDALPDPDTSLNTSLETRQSGSLAPSRWSRRPEVWFEAPVPPSGASRILRGGGGGRLTLLGNTAVRLDRPLPRDPSGGWTVAFHTDPVAGEQRSLGWVSITLTPTPSSLGWVIDPTNILGLLVRSNGALQLFHRAQERSISWADGPVAAAEQYDVVVRVAPTVEASVTVWRLEGRINGAAFTAELSRGAEARVPDDLLLGFGAHFHPGDETVSWIDDLSVGGLPR